MSQPTSSQPEAGSPTIYQIRILGHLGPRWADAFPDLALSLEANGVTLLTGPVIDQAALYGVLRKVRDLGLPLLSITCTELEPADSQGHDLSSLTQRKATQ